MRSIAILGSRGIPPRYGGFEAYAFNLAYGLHLADWRVTVFCESSLRRQRLDWAERVFWPVPEVGRVFFEFIYECVGILWATLAHVDVVYILGYPASFLAWLPRLAGKKVYLNPDGLEWQRHGLTGLAKWLFILAEYCSHIFPSALVYDSKIIEELHLAAYPYKYGYYLPYPYFNGHATETPFPDNSYYLVVARMVPENNLDIIVRGFMASDTDRDLVIVSNWRGVDESYVSYVMNIARHDRRIRFLRGVYDGSLPSLRRHAYAYVHGHQVGGTNPSLVEALFAGKPILALDTPFNREVAGHSACFWKKSPHSFGMAIYALENGLSSEPDFERDLVPFRFESAILEHVKVFAS